MTLAPCLRGSLSLVRYGGEDGRVGSLAMGMFLKMEVKTAR